MERKRQDTGLQIIMVCKYLVLAAAVGFAGWMFWSQNTAAIEFDTLCHQIEESGFMGDMNPVSDEDAQMLLGISKDDCTDFYYACTPQQGDAEEVLLVKTDSDRNSDRVEKAIEAHLTRQREKFQTEDPVQTDLLNQAVVKRQGAYVFLAVSKDCASLERSFLKNLK